MKKSFNLLIVVILLATIFASCKKQPVEGLFLDKTNLALVVGEKVALKVTFIPKNATNKAVSWSSSNNSVATVNNGVITAVSVGNAKITVTSEESYYTAICLVAVVQPIEPEMIFVEGGTFLMGCFDDECHHDGREEPAHLITLNNFKIGKYEVTQKEWKSIMNDNPSINSHNENFPVEMVSWNDVEQYIRKLNEFTGKNYRLPTEAEWEYAARGGNKSKGYKYSGSNDIDEVAWNGKQGEGSLSYLVGGKAPNELGIYDMSGNVLEWCKDWFGFYTDILQINPLGPSTGTNRIARGGSYYGDIVRCRVTYRFYLPPDAQHRNVGFRLVLPE